MLEIHDVFYSKMKTLLNSQLIISRAMRMKGFGSLRMADKFTKAKEWKA